MSDQQHDQPHDTPHDPLPSSLSSLFDSPHHHFLPASDDLIDPQLRDDDVAAAATVLELAEADADVRDDATSGSAGAKRPAEDGSGDGPGDGVPKRLRRTDPSPLDVTLVALLGENERLRKVVAALERPDEHQMQQEHEDMLAEATLRELATAAVGGFGFETLQSQLDASALLPLHEVEAVTVAVSAADYLHGLVTQITACAPAPAPTDPFAWTRAVLEDDIRATRETIARKEDEIDAIRHGTAVPEPEVQDQLALEGQLAMTATLLETVSRNVRVLRDIAARLQESHDEIAADLADKQEELAMLEDSVVAEGSAALGQVRGYIEGALKLWRERGQLPPAPLPHLPPLRPDAPPPSALPKKRGRPARSTQKPGVVPPALAHLVPDAQTVKARELEAPIRRKGIKRGKSELEREKAREEEEGEMLRSLVGMGVWREGYDDV